MNLDLSSHRSVPRPADFDHTGCRATCHCHRDVEVILAELVAQVIPEDDMHARFACYVKARMRLRMLTGPTGVPIFNPEPVTSILNGLTDSLHTRLPSQTPTNDRTPRAHERGREPL